METALVFIASLYILSTCVLWYVWESIDSFTPSIPSNNTRVTVIIAIRNEMKSLPRLLADLTNQSYPAGLTEILLINDHSTDESNSWFVQQHFPSNITMLLNNGSGKKQAILTGVKAAKGELLLFTDADCMVPAKWIETLVSYYQLHNASFISGPVQISGPTVFDKMQQYEFSTLIASGASTLRLGIPTMCNGANMAIKRTVYLEHMNEIGFNVSSGDDVFMFHAIYNSTPSGVHFIKSSDASVSTYASRGLSEFIQQRIRWASKWNAYKSISPQIIAGCIFLANASLIAWGALILLGQLNFNPFLTMLSLRWVIEALFIRKILKSFDNGFSLSIFLLTAITYPWYVVSIGLASQRRKYQWKDRSIHP